MLSAYQRLIAQYAEGQSHIYEDDKESLEAQDTDSGEASQEELLMELVSKIVGK